MSNTTSSVRNVFRPRGKGLLFILGGISMLITVGIVLAILTTVTQTTDYYVLSHAVKARDLITPSDLQKVTISANGAPRSYGMAQVQTGTLYAKYNLSAGDVLSDSNVTNKLTDIRAGLPSNYVVTSFTAAPAAAASGKIQAGDYVDLYVINDSSTDQNNSHMFLQHVLVIDAQASLDATDASSSSTSTDTSTTSTDGASGDATSAADAASTRAGIPSLFTVGLSQENAARLILANSKYSVAVVLSSQQASDATAPIAGSDVGASSDDIFSGDAPDGGANTQADPTATDAPSSSASATPVPSASASTGASTPAASATTGAQ